ncbi:MAG TPA: hypothetical protein GXX37_01440 [Clostridiaceae bacterium]|nr:hypothetical protein [Clostridiaceae bacterium]
MKYTKACRNCIKGRPISLTGDILCKYKGVVSSDYVCIRHKFIPNLKTFREMNYKCIDCVNFCVDRIPVNRTQNRTQAEHLALGHISYEISQNDSKNNQSCSSSSIGFCKLFSVRRFDGTQRSACSKFLMKPERRILMSSETETWNLEQNNLGQKSKQSFKQNLCQYSKQNPDHKLEQKIEQKYEEKSKNKYELKYNRNLEQITS